MSDNGIRTTEGCLKRAVVMKTTAELLLNQGDDWFAVCYFYAAYHTVRAAIMADPVFDNVGRLTAFAPWLVPADRFVTAHKARVAPNSPRKAGVNDVVTLLYPHIAAEYVRLHMASVEVRYQEGLRAIHRDSAVKDFHAVRDAYLEGRLISA